MPAETATQFAWRTLGMGEYPPPTPRRGPRFGAHPLCWLCGGPAGTESWPRAAAFPPTFTNANLARCPRSDAACQACVALAAKDTWDRYAAAHPDEGLKIGFSMSWRSYSHLFADRFHASPTRAGWRARLLEPPAPPFLASITTTGQKHVLFRGAVSHSRDRYPVQMEEETLLVDRTLFAGCLAAFERLYGMGFSKDQILGGDYAQVQVLKVGLIPWRAAEAGIAPYRSRHRDLLRVAHFCGQKEASDDGNAA